MLKKILKVATIVAGVAAVAVAVKDLVDTIKA
jgi:hypothetical protein